VLGRYHERWQMRCGNNCSVLARLRHRAFVLSTLMVMFTAPVTLATDHRPAAGERAELMTISRDGDKITARLGTEGKAIRSIDAERACELIEWTMTKSRITVLEKRSLPAAHHSRNTEGRRIACDHAGRHGCRRGRRQAGASLGGAWSLYGDDSQQKP